MLGGRERGVFLLVLHCKVACGVMFMNRVAADGAERDNSSIKSDALMGRSLRKGRRFKHSASGEGDVRAAFDPDFYL